MYGYVAGVGSCWHGDGSAHGDAAQVDATSPRRNLQRKSVSACVSVLVCGCFDNVVLSILLFRGWFRVVRVLAAGGVVEVFAAGSGIGHRLTCVWMLSSAQARGEAVLGAEVQGRNSEAAAAGGDGASGGGGGGASGGLVASMVRALSGVCARCLVVGALAGAHVLCWC